MMNSLIVVLCLAVWLMSCALCLTLGFFIGNRTKVKVKLKKAQILETDPEEKRKAEKYRRELYNLLTFDGTPQDRIE